MESNYNELLKTFTEFLKAESKTETIIGKEFQLGEFACVPVMSIGLGFGAGGGEGKSPAKSVMGGEGAGGGGGAGMGMSPIGFLVSRGEVIQFIATRPASGLSGVFEKVPEVLEKFLHKKDKPAEHPIE